MYISQTQNNFKSIYNDYDKPSKVNNRLKTMAIGTLVGGSTAALYYYKKKKYTGKKLFLNSLEMGAVVGLLADVTGLVTSTVENIKKKANVPFKGNHKNIDNVDVTYFRNKDFFKKLYSNNLEIDSDFEKCRELLKDEAVCDKLFQDEQVLLASQQALLELISQRILEYEQVNDKETVKQLKILQILLQKAINKQDLDKNINNYNNNNVSFKSIFNLFHNSNETLKERAEVAINRYASSAAATAGALANTGVGDTFALTLITKNMCKRIFQIYGCSGGYVAALTSASVGAVLGTNLLSKAVTIWPGGGNALNATITYTLHQLEGRALVEFLEEYGDELEGMEDVDLMAKYSYRLKAGLDIIKNEKVRDIIEKAIDKAFQVLL